MINVFHDLLKWEKGGKRTLMTLTVTLISDHRKEILATQGECVCTVALTPGWVPLAGENRSEQLSTNPPHDSL